MTAYTTAVNKDDDESHDTCPTCGTRVETKATADASGHQYRLECPACSWALPIERPLTATQDDAVLVTDGGMNITRRYDTARDRLGELPTDAADRVADAIDAEGERPSAADLRAVLEASDGRIAYLFQHGCGVEYVYCDENAVRCRTRHGDGKVWPPATLETNAALARRSRKRFDVVARENVPEWVTGGESA